MEKKESNKSDMDSDKDIGKLSKQENKDKVDEAKTKELGSDEKIKNLEDKLSRTLAEMENQRRRFEKERDDAFEYGGFSFAKETLNLIDNLERSKISLENDEELKNNKALKKISEHLDIIHNDMLSIFKKNNIEQINSLNQKLDPNYHQAMIEIEDDTKEPGTIVQEIQKGFLMKERLLRPSLVGVSKKSEKKEENKENNHEKNDENEEKKEKK